MGSALIFMPEKTRANIFVSGRVQGVFFRSQMQKKAKEFSVFGWVANLAKGQVEAVLEGEKENVQKLIDWAKRGPIFARVEKVEVNWEEYKGEFKDFEIKRQ